MKLGSLAVLLFLPESWAYSLADMDGLVGEGDGLELLSTTP